MRIVIACLALLALGAVSAYAQVAAPSLLPGTARVIDPEQFNTEIAVNGVNTTTPTDATFTTANPAAMQWARSEIGYGRLNVDSTLDSFGTQSSDSTDGDVVGLRWVNAYFSVAAEQVSLDRQVTANSDYSKTDHSSAALAVNLFDTLSLGVSTSRLEQKFLFIPTTVDLEVERETTLAGATLRLGGVFYLGLALGSEAADFLNVTNGPPAISFERDVSMYGVGLLTDGDVRWHLEWARLQREYGFDVDTSLNEEDGTMAVLELQYHQLVVSATVLDNTSIRDDPLVIGGIYHESVSSQIFGLAWISGSGLTVTATAESTEITGDADPVRKTIDAATLAVGYAF